MNGLRKLAFFLMTMMLAAFALPAAADKVYQVQMSSNPSPLAAGGAGQLVSMQINNVSSDTGNSNSSSFKLNAPSGFTIQQVYTVSRGQTKNTVAVDGGYTATIQVLNDGSAVWVSNIQVPLKPFGTPLQLKNMKVDVSCSANTSGLWVLPGVWTGSAFSGQTFSLTTNPQYPSIRNTTVSGICATYTITPVPNTANVNSGPGSSVSLSFNNTSPAGGGTIGSLQITAPTNFTITAATTSSGTATPINGGTAVKVTGASVGPGTSLSLTVTVTTPNCNGAAAAPWSAAQLYVNSDLTGQTFSGPGAGGYPSTGITGLGCSISFGNQNQPASAFSGYKISNTAYNNPNNNNPPSAPQSVTVNVMINGVAPPDSPPTVVTLSPHVGSCTVSNASANAVGGVATFGNLTAGAPGMDCTLTASALPPSGGGVGPSDDSNPPFDIVAPAAAPLVCATGSASSGTVNPPLDPRSSVPPPSDGQTGWALVRGQNVDSPCGPEIPYTFSCDANRNCQFTEDSLGQHPSIEYVVLWPAVNVVTDPTADKQPCVSWGVADPDAGTDPTVCGGDYVPGLACKTDNVDGGSAVMPDIPNLPPFNGFTGSDHPQYQVGQKAKVCISQHGFTSGTGAAVGSVVYWTKIIDQSDTGIRLP